MRVVDEKASTWIESKLTFLKPWKSFADVHLKLEEKERKTEVTWSMDSALPIFLFWMKPMMVAVIGMDYARGLAMLKDRLETGEIPSKLQFPGPQTLKGFSYVGIRRECGIPELGERMTEDFGRLKRWFFDEGLTPSDIPISIYHQWEPVKERVEYTSAFPVVAVPSDLPDGFVSDAVPDCNTFPIRHTGAYRHLGNAWSAGIARGRNKLIRQSRAIHPFERYETPPGEVPEDETITVVHFPLRD